ncbi:E3 ubiquitin-protein ligase BOI-like protein [Dioscorea alata]|uniref:E3 ubiquitin-protein ligase BOI-like protein n=2 Tax=Dioscorea alata TaxID=55571 RepID=A0ACB7WI12_DIOAL|nr:E3 ubiquitin-protein ligase BOI-like protein [Dioscorea alata]KAH7687488.1 E3 ubiquitin-protein ligase BOI-like protein [Dioscorea alata]
MAVQAQYPPNALFLHRAETEMKTMDYSQDQSPTAFFATTGGGGNPRKRGREAMAVVGQHGGTVSLFSLQPQPPPPTVVSLAQLQIQRQHTPAPPIVSTGLRLAFEDQTTFVSSSPSPSPSSSLPPLISSLLSDDLAVQIKQHNDEIDRFLRSQAEQLRTALTQTRHRHYRSLLAATEEAAARRLRDKDAEVERATRRSAELEDRLTRLRSELMAWQAKALSDQATAASLHVQLQQAAAAAATAGPVHGETNEPPADDAESAHIDPVRTKPSPKACRACHSRPLSVVLMPCRHLCLCSACDAAAISCPVCRSVRTGSVQVLLP